MTPATGRAGHGHAVSGPAGTGCDPESSIGAWGRVRREWRHGRQVRPHRRHLRPHPATGPAYRRSPDGAPRRGSRRFGAGRVACGTGNYTSALSARGLAMVGLDVSRTMLVRARTKHPLLPLVRGDGAALPFADGAFSHAVTTPGHSPHGGPARDLLEHPPRGGPGRPLPHLLRASRTTGDVLADELPPGDDGIGGARMPRREGGLRQ